MADPLTGALSPRRPSYWNPNGAPNALGADAEERLRQMELEAADTVRNGPLSRLPPLSPAGILATQRGLTQPPMDAEALQRLIGVLSSGGLR